MTISCEEFEQNTPKDIDKNIYTKWVGLLRDFGEGSTIDIFSVIFYSTCIF